MKRKETTTKEDLLIVINILENAGIIIHDFRVPGLKT